ncbi:MAG TPA: AtaL-like protein [Pseudonocardiaceae bacterium]|nr:AtaL-like protein [Pseudonocardiaceae bacterium]
METGTARSTSLTSSLPVRLSRDDLWAGLLRKAEDPVAFIPAITACTVLERRSDGSLVREIVVDGETRQRELVTFEPKRRIVFEQLTDPDLSAIVNQVDEDGDVLRLTLRIELSEHGMARAAREPGFLNGTRDYFAGTLRDIVATIHRPD